MNTTAPVMTVTDELLAELDLSVRAVWRDDDATVIAVDALTAELRHLRAENAELAKDAGRYRWFRMQDWYDGKLCALSNPKTVLTSGSGLGADCPSHERLDAAIDTAMATQ